jgi:hypothetical protein
VGWTDGRNLRIDFRGAGANPDDSRNAVLPKHQRIAASLSTIETILASSGAVERYD